MPLTGENKIHVLIVDDDAGSRLLMRRALERSGFLISEAADGAAAVAAVEIGACNAVLMDVERIGWMEDVDERLVEIADRVGALDGHIDAAGGSNGRVRVQARIPCA